MRFDGHYTRRADLAVSVLLCGSGESHPCKDVGVHPSFSQCRDEFVHNCTDHLIPFLSSSFCFLLPFILRFCICGSFCAEDEQMSRSYGFGQSRADVFVKHGRIDRMMWNADFAPAETRAGPLSPHAHTTPSLLRRSKLLVLAYHRRL